MSTSFSKLEKSGKFYACVVERPGKRELQIHPLQRDDTTGITVSSNLSTTFDLNHEDELLSLDWITKEETTTTRRSKRRTSNGGAKQTNSANVYAICTFKNGTIQSYSPFQKGAAVTQIIHDSAITASTTSGDKLWISTATEVLEFDINESKSKSIVKAPKDLKSVTQINHITIDNTAYLISTGNRIVVQDCSSGNVVGSIPLEETIHGTTAISGGALLTAKQDQIDVYGLPHLTAIHTIHAKGQVKSLFAVNDDENSAVAVLASGQVQIFKNVVEKLKVLTIRPNSKEVKFTTASVTEKETIVSWYDLEPKFAAVDNTTSEKSIKVDVQHQDKTTLKKVNKLVEPVFTQLKTKEQYVVRKNELTALINVKVDTTTDVLTVFVSNPDEAKIKTAVAQLEDEVAVKLYQKLQQRITMDPTESAALNNWVKWLVISHPAPLQALNSFKPLKSSIKKGLKQLPDLLSLQGRLELLQSQLSLRAEIAGHKDEDVEQKNGVDQAVKLAEESIVYVNGENDEGDVDDEGDEEESGDEGEQNDRDSMADEE